jgi:hypothetical protein
MTFSFFLISIHKIFFPSLTLNLFPFLGTSKMTSIIEDAVEFFIQVQLRLDFFFKSPLFLIQLFFWVMHDLEF